MVEVSCVTRLERWISIRLSVEDYEVVEDGDDGDDDSSAG
jgi:hypothetical protein